MLRYSDDKGRSWSRLIDVSAPASLTVGAQPVVQPDGDLTNVYLDFTTFEAARTVAQTSSNGGRTFGRPIDLGVNLGSEPPDMRTGVLPATVDRVTGRLQVVWQDLRFRPDGYNDIVITSSPDGQRWTGLRRVNRDPVTSGLDHLTPDVAADAGKVFVTYRTRANAGGPSRFVGMRFTASADGGRRQAGRLPGLECRRPPARPGRPLPPDDLERDHPTLAGPADGEPGGERVGVVADRVGEPARFTAAW